MIKSTTLIYVASFSKHCRVYKKKKTLTDGTISKSNYINENNRTNTSVKLTKSKTKVN